MEKYWPAVELSRCDAELALAIVDDAGPTAVEDTDDGVRIFFSTPEQRDAAALLLTAHGYPARPITVSDEDWAARSQADLKPVTVGRFTVFPNPESRVPNPFSITLPPSTAFGTGHHATTRLCLAALQRVPIEGRRVLDVGTGSGLLAIAAARLGAAAVLGVDNDPDAIRTAEENLALNGGDTRVRFERVDLRDLSIAPADVVVANLTAALLCAEAAALRRAAAPGGRLVLSGLLADESGAVEAAMGGASPEWRADEDGWTVLVAGRD